MNPVDLSNPTGKTRTEKNLHLKFESIAPKIEHPPPPPHFFKLVACYLQEVDSAVCCCGEPRSHRVEQIHQSQVAGSPVR